MGKVRRKFDADFKRQIVQEILSGSLTRSSAARQYQLSYNTVDTWVQKHATGEEFVNSPSPRERQLERENEELKARLGELVLQIHHLKKLDAFVRQRKNETTSIVTRKTLVQSSKDVA